MSMLEDFAPFFSIEEFADSATLGGEPVAGVLESGFEDATLAGFGVAGTSPRFTLAAASVPARSEGLALVVTTGVGAGTYRVTNSYPDGTGLATLHLTAN